MEALGFSPGRYNSGMSVRKVLSTLAEIMRLMYADPPGA
jgi:hypothetical protein